MDNPYSWCDPVHDAITFAGREHEIIEIATFLRGNQSVAIVGPAKIGKTSLLLHLMQPQVRIKAGLGDENLLATMNCRVISNKQPGEILASFCTAIAAALHQVGVEPEPALIAAIPNPTWSAFEAALRKLNQRGLRLVLMLDDFEQLTANPAVEVSFYNALRSLAGRFHLVYLTCSRKPLVELTYLDRSKGILTSPFFNIFAQQYLGLLSESEAYDLIRKPMQAGGRVISQPVVDFIYQLVGGHPFALQVACFHAWNNPGDLVKIEASTGLELETHFKECWESLTLAEREVLHRLAEVGQRGMNDPLLKRTLRDLIHNGLLVQADEGYRYPSRAWAEFISAAKLSHEAVAGFQPMVALPETDVVDGATSEVIEQAIDAATAVYSDEEQAKEKESVPCSLDDVGMPKRRHRSRQP